MKAINVLRPSSKIKYVYIVVGVYKWHSGKGVCLSVHNSRKAAVEAVFQGRDPDEFGGGRNIRKVEKTLHIKPGDVHDYDMVVSHPEYYR
jgi:hypothetical protein